MKKTLMLLSVTLQCAVCDPAAYLDYHEGYWYIKNCTDQALVWSFPPATHPSYDYNLNMGDSVSLGSQRFQRIQNVPPYFDSVIKLWGENGDDISLEIFSEDGVLLKRWDYSDRDLSGKQFLKEPYWTYSEKHRGNLIIGAWTFSIFPEDIAPVP